MEAITKKLPLSMLICIALVATVMMMTSSEASIEDDEKECADQLTKLAACIPFVSGSAKMPTKECCDNTDKIRAAQPKCLCVLIKESSDPSMGLPINTTLALQMPAACKIQAKISDCPCNDLYIYILYSFVSSLLRFILHVLVSTCLCSLRINGNIYEWIS